jgi:hypothetical protein
MMAVPITISTIAALELMPRLPASARDITNAREGLFALLFETALPLVSRREPHTARPDLRRLARRWLQSGAEPSEEPAGNTSFQK